MNFNWKNIKRAFRLQLPPQHPYDAGVTLGSRPYEALPNVTPVVTYITLLISAVLYYLTDIVTKEDPTATMAMLNKMGHRDNLNIILGDWWALMSTAFFHGSLTHFLFNSMALISLGSVFEKGIGSLKTLILYLSFACVTMGYQLLVSDLSLVLQPEDTFFITHQYAHFGSALGLSGILFAVIGFMWGSWKRWTGFLGIFNKRTLNFSFMWLLLCYVLSYASPNFNYANTAHLSGLIMGFLVGMWMCYGIKHAKLWFSLTAAMVILMVSSLVFYHFHFSRVLEPHIPALKKAGWVVDRPLFK